MVHGSLVEQIPRPKHPDIENTRYVPHVPSTLYSNISSGLITTELGAIIHILLNNLPKDVRLVSRGTGAQMPRDARALVSPHRVLRDRRGQVFGSWRQPRGYHSACCIGCRRGRCRTIGRNRVAPLERCGAACEVRPSRDGRRTLSPAGRAAPMPRPFRPGPRPLAPAPVALR